MKPHRTIYRGDNHQRAQWLYQTIARRTYYKFERYIESTGIRTGVWPHTTPDGDTVVWRYGGGFFNVQIIPTEEPPPEDDKDPILFKFKLYRENKTIINQDMLSYLVLCVPGETDEEFSIIYKYIAMPPTDVVSDPIGYSDKGYFYISLGMIPTGAEPPRVWAFYSFHEDQSVWGYSHIIRTGVRTQYPLRHRQGYFLNQDDMIIPGSYVDIIPYGVFKFNIFNPESGEELTGGLEFKFFSGETGEITNSQENLLTEYEKIDDGKKLITCDTTIEYSDGWEKYVEEDDAQGFWVFIIDQYADKKPGDEKDNNGLGVVVDRSGRCTSKEETDEDDEDEETAPQEDRYLKDGVLQYKHKCKEENKLKVDDLILPAPPPLQDSLCEESPVEENRTTSSGYGDRDDPTKWMCFKLHRECDGAEVKPESPEGAVLASFGIGGSVYPSYFTVRPGDEDYPKYDESEFWKSWPVGPGGQAAVYGYDPELEKNVWRVAIPGVFYNYRGALCEEAWALKEFDDQKEEDFKDRGDEDEKPIDDSRIVRYTSVHHDTLAYNKRTGRWEVYLGSVPHPSYAAAYNTPKGIETWYNSQCCVRWAEDNTRPSIYALHTCSAGGGYRPYGGGECQNFFTDDIGCGVLYVTVTCAGDAVTSGASFDVYDQDGNYLDLNGSWNKDKRAWAIPMAGKAGCGQSDCSEYGYYVVARSGRCSETLYGADCDWTTFADGTMISEAGEIDIELCVTCPTCEDLVDIDPQKIKGGQSVTMKFLSARQEKCPDFVDSLGDGLPDDFKGTFTDLGGDGEYYKVKYTANKNLCDETVGCPTLCGNTMTCCCFCDEENGPGVEVVEEDLDTCVCTYRIIPGCAPFRLYISTKDYPCGDETDSDWKFLRNIPGCMFHAPCPTCEGGTTCVKPRRYKIADSLNRSTEFAAEKTPTEEWQHLKTSSDNPDEFSPPTSVTVAVEGGVGPFEWNISPETDASLAHDQTTGRGNTASFTADACGTYTITVQDVCCDSATIKLLSINGAWVVWSTSKTASCPVTGTPTSGDETNGTLIKDEWKIDESRSRSSGCLSAGSWGDGSDDDGNAVCSWWCTDAHIDRTFCLTPPPDHDPPPGGCIAEGNYNCSKQCICGVSRVAWHYNWWYGSEKNSLCRDDYNVNRTIYHWECP